MNQMDFCCRIFVFLLVLLWFSLSLHATSHEAGDADPIYRACMEQCMKTGCVGETCLPHCKFSADGQPIDAPWKKEPLYLHYKLWDCRGDCRYLCMLERETARAKLGLQPRKYHGKWLFRQVFGIQEPASCALSAANLAIQFHGWLSFAVLVYYRLPLREDRKPYYEYTGLWHIYGILTMNSWFWSAVFHSRHITLTERLYDSSSVSLITWGFLVGVLRAFKVRTEASRVMICAPLISLLATHILFLNLYEFNHGLNTAVRVVLGISQMFVFAFWAALTRHPSRYKLWIVFVGGCSAMLLETLDFPPVWGYVDVTALWHATTLPLAYIWWNYVKEDAEYVTSGILKKGD